MLNHVGHVPPLYEPSSLFFRFFLKSGGTGLRPAPPDFAAQLLLAVHWPPYLNSGADLSWSLVAFMVAFQTLF